MNILMITHYAGAGGANHELLWLAKELIDRGHHISILLPCDGSFTKTLQKEQIYYKILPYKRWICRKNEKSKKFICVKKLGFWIRNRLVALSIANFVKKNKINVIHTNDSLDVVGCYASQIVKIPHVWHLREFLEEDYNLSIIYSDKYVQKWFAKSSRMIAISQTIKHKYAPRIIRDNIVQIYDGIPIFFGMAIIEKQSKDDMVKILYTGGTNEGKGFSEALKIAGELKRRNDLHFILQVTGDCTQKEKYLPLIEEQQISNNVEFIGFTNQLNVLRQKADIFLMTSQMEAFGLVTVEAMLSGLRVVGRKCGGTEEIISDGENGFLYEPGNVLHACEKIKQALALPDDGIELRKRAYQDAVSRFDIRRTADQMEQLYHEVLAKEK